MNLKIGNQRTLEQIIKLDGHCLNSELCIACPFAHKCLIEFLTGRGWSRQKRVMMALDQIACKELLEDDLDVTSR